MDERERRLAKNEIMFRSLNERVEEIAVTHGVDDHGYEFMCECSNIDCNRRVQLTIAAYEQARSDPAVFIVAPGHELPEIEQVVRRTAGYHLVRKHGEAADLAEERDPRGT